MQRNLVRIEPAQVHFDQCFAPRHIGTASMSKGFFTLGFAVVILAASSLFVGSSEALSGSDSASAPTPSKAVVEGTAAVDQGKSEKARNAVVISEAPAGSPDNASGPAKPLQ